MKISIETAFYISSYIAMITTTTITFKSLLVITAIFAKRTNFDALSFLND